MLEGDRATGVTYRRGGATHTVARPTREVLLCGGAVNSPQLLMLSGIGPAAHLREHGIDVARRPAGRRRRTCRTTRSVPLIWHTRGTTDLAELQQRCATSLRWKAAAPAR